MRIDPAQTVVASKLPVRNSPRSFHVRVDGDLRELVESAGRQRILFCFAVMFTIVAPVLFGGALLYASVSQLPSGHPWRSAAVAASLALGGTVWLIALSATLNHFLRIVPRRELVAIRFDCQADLVSTPFASSTFVIERARIRGLLLQIVDFRVRCGGYRTGGSLCHIAAILHDSAPGEAVTLYACCYYQMMSQRLAKDFELAVENYCREIGVEFNLDRSHERQELDGGLHGDIMRRLK